MGASRAARGVAWHQGHDSRRQPMPPAQKRLLQAKPHGLYQVFAHLRQLVEELVKSMLVEQQQFDSCGRR